MGWEINTGSVIKMLEQSLAQRQQPQPGDYHQGPLATVQDERKAAGTKPKLMTRKQIDKLIRQHNDIPPYRDRYNYQPPGTVDHQTVWQYHMPGYLTMPGHGIENDQRPAVPHMTTAPGEQAVIDKMQEGMAAQSTPFVHGGSDYNNNVDYEYAYTPKVRKQITQFNKRHPIVHSTPTAGPNGHGYYMLYESKDGKFIRVPTFVSRSYGS